MKTILLSCAAILVAITPSKAAFNYTSELQFVTATAGVGGNYDQQTEYAPTDFSPWAGAASASYVNDPVSAHAEAGQTSLFLDDLISVTGHVTASHNGGFQTHAQAGSVLNIYFSLAVDTPYTFILVATPGYLTSSYLLEETQGLSFAPNTQGTLPVGGYHLNVSFSAYVPPGDAGSLHGLYSYGLALGPTAVPVPTSSAIWIVGIVLPAWNLCRRRR